MSNCVCKFAAVLSIAVVVLGSNLVLADRDRGSRDDRSDRSRQSDSSTSRNASPPSRSVLSGQSPSSFSGGSSRSSNSGSVQSLKSPTIDLAPRPLTDGNRGNTFSGKSLTDRQSFKQQPTIDTSQLRALGRQTVARPIEGASPGRGAENVGSAFRGWSRGAASTAGTEERRSSNNTSGDVQLKRQEDPQFGRSFGRAPSSEAITREQLIDKNTGSNNSKPLGRRSTQKDGQAGNSQSPGNTFRSGNDDMRFGRSQDNQIGDPRTSAGPTKQKVGDFLQLRRDDSGKPSGTVADQSIRGKFNRGGIETNLGRNASAPLDQSNLQRRILESKKDGDQSWTKRFGNPDGATRDRARRDDDRNPLNGKGSNLDDGKLRSEKGIAKDRKFDRGEIDRKYVDWRKKVSDDKHGSVADHRDWSGRWKDGERLLAADDIRHHWKNGRDRKDIPFANDWWRKNHHHHDHWDNFANHHHHHSHFWWDWCSAPRLRTWITFDWGAPCFWDYGPGEYIYCNNGVVFVNGVWFEPAPIFYQRTVVIARRAPNWTPLQAAQVEWLPLGVFVVARDGVADNNVLVQLAVTKDGVIGGTIFNQLTGATFPIEGSVDKETQRAVWTYDDGKGAQIVMESSIFNLTQPEATGLIHYGPNDIQLIELVRLEQPAGGA